jgi:hypothetical protein
MQDDIDFNKLGGQVYGEVNDIWMPHFPLRTLTREEGGKIAQHLLAKFWPKEIPTGYQPRWARRSRRCWASTKRTASNLDSGIRRIVHDIGHVINDEGTAGKKKTHWHGHATLELEMAQWVISKGWHKPKQPKAKPAKPAPHELRAQKLDATRAKIKRWQTKAKRAATALRKLRARERGLERALAA